ncbi:MAG TPA: RsmE family RNA methyltransferase [Gemmatimonadales bacterium]|nr:RsmE family RNA methyltransferase [Gemmatimonadales bacterium]
MIVLVPEGVAPGDLVPLSSSELRHLRVRRAAHGSEVELRDGRGLAGRGLLRLDGRSAAVEVRTTERVAPPVALALAVGAGDRERYAWLVEKAAELGVTDLHPLETERAGSVGPRVRAGGLDRLRRRALEALKQCGATWALCVHEPEPLAQWLARSRPGALWLGDPEGDAPPRLDRHAPVTVLIGPEGGLTGAERDSVRSAGYRPVRLGPHTLRFETAALAAAALVWTARVGGGGPYG